jgi:hypothetical protein
MNITGINFAGVPMPLPDGQKGGKAQPGTPSTRKDRVELSKDSRKKDSTSAGISAVAAAGDPVREDKIQEVRAKLDAGYYDQPEVIDQTAQKLIDKKLV